MSSFSDCVILLLLSVSSNWVLNFNISLTSGWRISCAICFYRRESNIDCTKSVIFFNIMLYHLRRVLADAFIISHQIVRCQFPPKSVHTSAVSAVERMIGTMGNATAKWIINLLFWHNYYRLVIKCVMAFPCLIKAFFWLLLSAISNHSTLKLALQIVYISFSGARWRMALHMGGFLLSANNLYASLRRTDFAIGSLGC